MSATVAFRGDCVLHMTSSVKHQFDNGFLSQMPIVGLIGIALMIE
jgi:hypothetical protein